MPVQFFWQGVSVFTTGRNPEGAKAFLRYLSRPERLGPYVEAGQGRWFPALRELADTQFWTDAADPHRSMLRQQMTNAPRKKPWGSQDLKFEQVFAEKVWPKAIAHIVVEGWTPERAADEAIARTKQILSE
jgi:multiple sugar transport system substrate-binding protein